MEMSEYLKEQSVLYNGQYYHEDECIICDECGANTPEDFMSDDICEDCRDAKDYADSVQFDYNKAISV